MEISARNQLRGRITSVHAGTIMAEVAIAIEAADLTAVVTRGSVERMQLHEGDDVTVIIKSTEVMVGNDAKVSESSKDAFRYSRLAQ